MKRFMIGMVLILSCCATLNAQVIYPDQSSNSEFTLTFWQWTAYSDYAGYYVGIDNHTDEAITVTVTIPRLGIVETVTVEPYQYTTYLQLGIGEPYIEGLVIQARTDTPGSNLKVKTIGSPYASRKKR